MRHRSMRDAVLDLERHGQLVRISAEVDPHLEMAEIQRRAYRAQAPALLFERVKGSPFPAVSNLFGTLDRARFLFRHTFARVQKAIELRADPTVVLRRPWRYLDAPFTGLASLPMRAWRAPVLAHRTSLSALPGIVSWPDDGGPFVTLPQVYSEDPDDPRPLRSNVGMYRIQLAGNDYRPDREVGLHYQIHRGIGIHHSAAVRRGEKLRVSVFVGGPPAHTVAAVMPLPEGLSELVFAGMLAGRRFRHTTWNGHRIAADADFAIVGTIDPTRTLPEGPFGDHLGYYAKVHDFPVLEVEGVFHREGAIWPFTVVGRPPQEDTTFGALIHDLTGPMVPVSLPGVHALHAVDAAGVHPLLLAIGSERYVPYRREAPQELLTIANAILGFSQASLAKVLMIVAKDDVPDLDIHDVGAFLEHVLSRFDPRRDLHFQTKTTMDTLDYSGTGLNAGSKLVIAALGPARRTLTRNLPGGLRLPDGFVDPRLARPGVLAVRGPKWTSPEAGAPSVHGSHPDIRRLATSLDAADPALQEIAVIVVCDDPDFVTRSLENFLWATFTRINPSHDVDGVGATVEHKHWGCTGPLVFDARRKDHHAPPLIEDPEVTRRVDTLAAKGGPLHGLLG